MWVRNWERSAEATRSLRRWQQRGRLTTKTKYFGFMSAPSLHAAAYIQHIHTIHSLATVIHMCSLNKLCYDFQHAIIQPQQLHSFGTCVYHSYHTRIFISVWKTEYKCVCWIEHGQLTIQWYNALFPHRSSCVSNFLHEIKCIFGDHMCRKQSHGNHKQQPSVYVLIRCRQTCFPCVANTAAFTRWYVNFYSILFLSKGKFDSIACVRDAATHWEFCLCEEISFHVDWHNDGYAKSMGNVKESALKIDAPAFEEFVRQGCSTRISSVTASFRRQATDQRERRRKKKLKLKIVCDYWNEMTKSISFSM